MNPLRDLKEYVESRRVNIGVGEVIPDGYGIAFFYDECWLPDETLVACYPLGLNVMVGVSRWLWLRVRHGWFWRTSGAIKRIRDLEKTVDDLQRKNASLRAEYDLPFVVYEHP